MLSSEIKKFYSDGLPHSNTELYEYLKLKGYDYNNYEHVARGIQQTMKRKGKLISMGNGVWRAI